MEKEYVWVNSDLFRLFR